VNVTARKTAARIGSDFVSGLLAHMGISARVKAKETAEGTVTIALEGDDAAFDVLGRDRDLQAAIAQLAGQATSQALDARVRVYLDFGDETPERGAREAFLGDMAAELAALVARSGRRAVIEGLDSAERRLVHTALMDHGDVQTHSEGGESNRYLLVQPRA
jgi:spoIIIJ-associated protein